MQLGAVSHAFDRFDFTTFRIQPEHQTRKYRTPVNQHGARATLTELTTMLRAREIQVFTQHFQQCLMRRKGYLGVFAVKTEANLSLTVHQELLRCGVLLLNLIQNHVVDQTRLADVGGDGDESWLFVDALDRFQRLCVSYAHVVQTRAWFTFDRRTDDVGDASGAAFAVLESALRLFQRTVYHGR